MSESEDESKQLVPTSEEPTRAVDRAARWRRAYNREYVRRVPLPTGAGRYALTEKGRAAIRAASAGGMALGAIARNVLGISAAAFEDMRKREPDVQELVEYGRELLADEITDLLLTQARSGVVASTIFLARSRAGFDNDGGKIEGSRQPKIVNNTLNVTFAEPMSKADFAALMGGKLIEAEKT